jgi:hypothetical protein
MTRGIVRKGVLALAMLLAAGTAAFAQSAITGVVKDTSGAVLPGVTVEAASDALIERVKSVITDGDGIYRIVDLRPGTYSVTFSLPGFQTLRRDALALPSEFTMTINGEMKVGSLEETITVSGDAPVVDVSSAVHTQVLNREAIDAIPTGRTIQGLGQLVVGVSLSLPDTGGARAMQQTYMSTHGMPAASNTVMVDGMIVNGLQGDGAIQSYFNDAMNQEVSYQTSGIGAETSAGGVRLNMIPREGGNTFSGAFGAAYRPGAWQGDNVGPRLQAKGLTPGEGNGIDRIIDFTVSEGGPIKQDKLWFFASARYFSVNNFIADTEFDDGSRGVDDQFIRSALVRLTWQITPKIKLSAYQDEIDKYRGHDMQAKYDPETAGVVWNSPAYHTNQAKISSPVTSRLLVEGGFSSNLEYYTNEYRPGIERPRFSADWYANTGQQEALLGGFVQRAPTGAQNTQSPARYNWQGAVSYVTGSHNFKTGVQYQRGTFYHTYDSNGDGYQVYRSLAAGTAGCQSANTPASQLGATGVFSCPDQFVIRNTPLASFGERVNYDLGLFVQDAYTINRLTINAGLRYEFLNAQVEPSDSPAGRFVPARSFGVKKDLPNWRDPAPRIAAVYDLFGNSKTALKYSLNRYNQTRTTGIASIYQPYTSSTFALNWRDLNNDGIAQGGVTYPGGVRTLCTFGVGDCELYGAGGPAGNAATAITPTFGVVPEAEYNGFPRTWNLEHGLELQHELMPRLSVTGTWFHGAFHNLTISNNLSLNKDLDWAPIQVWNPLTGEEIKGVYRRLATRADGTPVSTSAVTTDSLAPDRELIYNSYGVEFRARPGRGSQVFGGFAFERQQSINCGYTDNPNNLLLCDDRENSVPFNKQFKVAGSYPLPWGVQLSGSFQSNPSPNGTVGITAASIQSTTYMAATASSTYPTTCPAPCPAGARVLPTGAVFAGTASSINIPLVAPNAYQLERINQLDFKVQKTFRVNRVQISPQFEVFNVNNSDAVISVTTGGVGNNVLSPNYLFANSVMQPTIVGVGASVKW